MDCSCNNIIYTLLCELKTIDVWNSPCHRKVVILICLRIIGIIIAHTTVYISGIYDVYGKIFVRVTARFVENARANRRRVGICMSSRTGRLYIISIEQISLNSCAILNIRVYCSNIVVTLPVIHFGRGAADD